MGTIPAPNIAELGGQIAQAPANAMQEYARVAALRQQTAASQQQMQQQAALAPGQQQLQQQQVQSGQLSLQEQQREAQDAQAVRDAYKNSGGDLDKFQKNMLAAGVGPKASLGATTMINGMRQSVNALGESDLKLLQTKHEQLAPKLDAVLAANPQDQPGLWNKTIADALTEGLITPQEAQQHGQYPGADGVRIYSNSLKTIDQLLKEREANEKDWEVVAPLGVRVNKVTGETQPVAGAAMSPQMMEAKYVALAGKKAAGQPIAADDANFMKGYEKYKTLVPVANFNLQANGVPTSGAAAAAAQGQSDPQALQKAVPANIRPTVQAIVEGRQSPPGSFALKTPYWQNVMNQVYALDPQWNEQRAQIRKAYTLGPQSKEINAINTAMGHVGVLNDSIDALNNGDVHALNAIANRFGVETGNTPVTTFNTIIHRVGPELSKAYLGAGGSAGERGADEKDFDPNLGPAQLRTNVAATAQLLRSKISSLENQWDQNAAPGVQSFQDRFIMPEAKRQLQKINPTGAGGGGKIATSQHVADYAKAKGVSVQQATQEFKQSGYTIQ